MTNDKHNAPIKLTPPPKPSVAAALRLLRGIGTAHDQLCNERRISDQLEKDLDAASSTNGTTAEIDAGLEVDEVCKLCNYALAYLAASEKRADIEKRAEDWERASMLRDNIIDHWMDELAASEKRNEILVDVLTDVVEYLYKIDPAAYQYLHGLAETEQPDATEPEVTE